MTIMALQNQSIRFRVLDHSKIQQNVVFSQLDSLIVLTPKESLQNETYFMTNVLSMIQETRRKTSIVVFEGTHNLTNYSPPLLLPVLLCDNLSFKMPQIEVVARKINLPQNFLDMRCYLSQQSKQKSGMVVKIKICKYIDDLLRSTALKMVLALILKNFGLKMPEISTHFFNFLFLESQKTIVHWVMFEGQLTQKDEDTFAVIASKMAQNSYFYWIYQKSDDFIHVKQVVTITNVTKAIINDIIQVNGHYTEVQNLQGRVTKFF
jgi:hypothetical protein